MILTCFSQPRWSKMYKFKVCWHSTSWWLLAAQLNGQHGAHQPDVASKASKLEVPRGDSEQQFCVAWASWAPQTWDNQGDSELCFSLEPRHFKRDTFWFSVVGLNAVACKLRHADDGPCNAQMTWRGRAPAISALFFPSLPFRRFSRLSGRELQECKTCLSGLSQHFQPVRLVYFVQDALQIKLEDWKQHPREAAQVLSLWWWVESSLVPATNRILTLDAGLAEDRAAKADSKIFAGPKIPVSPSSRGR